MRLIDLKTDLKSLRYGNDRFNGGSSGQPFITTPIPDNYIGSRPDFLLRQGALDTTPVTIGGVTLPVPTDSVRITKFLDSLEGQLFITKQIALERQNPAIPGGLTRIYNPLNTIAQVGSIPLGFHLNKQGETGLVLSYAQGGTEGYFNYTLNKGIEDNTSRLSLLYDTKITSTSDIEGRRGPLLREFDISGDSGFSLSYNGGPDSVGGIGRTRIKLAGVVGDPRNRTNTYKLVSDPIQNPNRIYSFTNDLLSQQESKGKTKSTYLSGITDYRKTINENNPNSSIFPFTNYSTFNREKTYGTSGTVYSILPINLSNPNSSVSVDALNATLPTILSEAQNPNNSFFDKDLIKFFFEVINPNVVEKSNDRSSEFLFFRAYINDLGDSFKSEWQPYKYVGRAENFYKYTGFSRDISLSFTVYAHSRAEMIPIYTKLNRLVGVTAPTYGGNGYMLGNFIKLTVGDYLNNVPGIINTINLKPSFEAGWDINRDIEGGAFDSTSGNLNVGQVPRMIEVDLSFTPIHDFIPKYGNTFINNTTTTPTPSPTPPPSSNNTPQTSTSIPETIDTPVTENISPFGTPDPTVNQLINSTDSSGNPVDWGANTPYIEPPVTALESSVDSTNTAPQTPTPAQLDLAASALIQSL